MPDIGAAQAQSVLMLQKVNKMIELVQSLDSRLAKKFSAIKADDASLQEYRQPLQTEVGGIFGAYQPDGGNYFQGSIPQYTQMIVAPVPVLAAVATTELARRLSQGGQDIVVRNFLSRMIGDVKRKCAHKHSIFLQTFNDGKIATVDSSYSSGTTVPLTAGEFGGRLIDLGDRLQIFDSSKNLRGIVNILSVNKNSIGGIDTVEIDAAPAGLTATDGFYPLNVAQGNPVFMAGLKYLVSGTTSGDYFGINRAMPYVQSPAVNANSSYFTVGTVLLAQARLEQALGSDRFSELKSNFWYLHRANLTSYQMQGVGKQIVVMKDGKAPKYDGAPNAYEPDMVGGQEAIVESIAAVDKAYNLDASVLSCVQYPGSAAFIPSGMGGDGLFWPRQVGGNWNTGSDALYQDSRNYFSRNNWAHLVVSGLATQPGFAV